MHWAADGVTLFSLECLNINHARLLYKTCFSMCFYVLWDEPQMFVLAFLEKAFIVFYKDLSACVLVLLKVLQCKRVTVQILLGLTQYLPLWAFVSLMVITEAVFLPNVQSEGAWRAQSLDGNSYREHIRMSSWPPVSTKYTGGKVKAGKSLTRPRIHDSSVQNVPSCITFQMQLTKALLLLVVVLAVLCVSGFAWFKETLHRMK